MKYKIKQYLSMALAVITLVTSIPITSYAVIGEASGGASGGAIGSGDNSSSSSGASGNGSFNSNMLGIRFTLVDKSVVRQIGISSFLHFI